MLGQILEPVRIEDMFAAERRIRQYFPPSPLLSMAPLNLQLGCEVFLKAESLLPTGAYKYRGALNKSACLVEEFGTGIGIVAASSGNHGMACARAASMLGIRATIVVPKITPQIKQDCISALGAKIVVAGDTYDTSFKEACRIAEEENLHYLHPVADRYILGGQGTILLELLQQLPDVDQIIVPLGGGGLISGIAFAAKTLKPSIKIAGVMPEGSCVYVESRKAGKLLELSECASMADAVVRKTGEPYLFPYIEEYVDDLYTVSEQSIEQAVRLASLYGKLTLEGSGALALAALLEKRFAPTAGTVLICSGGNIDGPVFERCLAAR